MCKAIISTLLLCGLFQFAQAATVGDLEDKAPDRYAVVKGDTLWGIAGRFLKDPWRWPELWKMNQDQVRNPHRIYPGDVLVLDRSAPEVALRVLKTETVVLSPQVRAEPLPPEPVPTIPLSAIEPFLSKPVVISAQEYEAWPQIVATQENRIVLGIGNSIHVKNLDAPLGSFWRIYRRGKELLDPATKQPLGNLAVYLGEARVVEKAALTTLEITAARQEINLGDRLVPAPIETVVDNFVPHPPATPIKGNVVDIYGNVYEAGLYSIVALSKGAKDGLEVGHVLALRRNQNTVDSLRSRPVYSRQDEPVAEGEAEYRSRPLRTRDTPVYGRQGPLGADEPDGAIVVPIRDLPDLRYGLVMVFRTFEHASFALVMQADRPVHILDVVTGP